MRPASLIEQLASRYAAAIFDFDGTLADSMDVWDTVCRRWLTSKGIYAGEALERDISAMTLTQSAEYVRRQYGLSLPVSCVLEEWEELVCRQYLHTVPLKAGAAALAADLARRGMKMGIATSCFPAACEGALARHGIREYFSAILYTHEAARDKTFPDVYLACAARLGAAPESCVVFEDFPAAASGVRAAGMGLVAVYDRHSAKHWDAFRHEADFALLPVR
ncbi:MAG: HAD family phosphatase [Spirochaetaceae bacterium]|jgi:HAD superfamily hydrolase (TIGR01509 family)|nr:HAD family phosphatase [Spirochaetaceae bacterium]